MPGADPETELIENAGYKLLRGICMHITAKNPVAARREDVPVTAMREAAAQFTVERSAALYLDVLAATAANAAVVPVGQGGMLDVSTFEAAHLVVDLTGYWIPAGSKIDGRLHSASTPTRVASLGRRSAATLGRCKVWRLVPTGTGWRPRAPTRPCVCGMPTPATTAARRSAATPAA